METNEERAARWRKLRLFVESLRLDDAPICRRCGDPSPNGLNHGDLCDRCDHVANERDDDEEETE